MKHIFFKKNFLICSLFLIMMQSTSLAAKEPHCKKVVLQYVDFDIFTTADVSCTRFNTAFNDEIQTRTITNGQKIKELIVLLNKLKIDKKAKSVDVRMKIKLYYNHSVEVICLDRFDALKGGQIYEMDKSLFQFIETLKNHK
jgi:hypothetical protein